MKINRRNFLQKTALTGAVGLSLPYLAFPIPPTTSEVLYNGVRLPEVWPPKNMDPTAYKPMPVPYLSSQSSVIPIDIGRQLFVDDFLIEETNLKRHFYHAKKYENNPVFKPETKLEEGYYGITTAAPKDGGVWWDPNDGLFKMWYEAGWMQDSAYAISEDGINWQRPDLDLQPGTNRILPYLISDSTTVFLDHFTDNPNERFKMFLRPSNTPAVKKGFCMTSPDGIHWSLPVETGLCGDRSTIFYNPFRKKWVYSIRSTGDIENIPIGRARYYREHDDFMKGARWDLKDIVFWTGADNLDIPDPQIGDNPQLYNLSAVGYESIMLGLHQIHLGPDNEICASKGSPKITELMTSFSRDGFHWDRPDRSAFINASREDGFWDKGYVQSVGGICSIVGDKLWFYYSGVKGNPNKLDKNFYKNGMHYGCSAGIAVLRRDGFASMSAMGNGGVLTTRPVTFKGKFLFVNVDCPQGELKVEILDRNSKAIAPFSIDNSIPVSIDNTIQEIAWKNTADLSSLTGKDIRFRFHLERGRLYAFWVSPDKSGASHGYNAAGGPGFKGGIDLEGKEAYLKAKPFAKL